jgi:peptidyl-prolyl cis-trans isomerase C
VKRNNILSCLLFVMILLIFTACNTGVDQTPDISPTAEISATSLPESSPTPAPPTPTPEPLAASVNGEGISLADFEAELARYQAANPDVVLGEAERQLVLGSLVDTLLLAQAAFEAGYQPSEAEVQARLDSLIQEAGGMEVFQAWMATNYYTEDSFRRALGMNMAAAWQRDQISAAAPSTAEQVHARQIFLYNSEEAKNVLDRLQAGTDFVTIAAEVDPIAAGELGWFPRGYLLEPAVEEAAFALQPGEYSQVIETRLGFHIVQVIERQADRLLEPDAQMVLQRLAIREWLEANRSQSKLEIFLP